MKSFTEYNHSRFKETKEDGDRHKTKGNKAKRHNENQRLRAADNYEEYDYENFEKFKKK